MAETTIRYSRRGSCSLRPYPCAVAIRSGKLTGIELDESYQLLNLAELDSSTADREPRFADVRMAWGAEGLLMNVKVADKQQPVWCRDGRLEDSDGYKFGSIPARR